MLHSFLVALQATCFHRRKDVEPHGRDFCGRIDPDTPELLASMMLGDSDLIGFCLDSFVLASSVKSYR